MKRWHHHFLGMSASEIFWLIRASVRLVITILLLFLFTSYLYFYTLKKIYDNRIVLKLYLFCGKGKYRSTDNTKIGKEKGNSYCSFLTWCSHTSHTFTLFWLRKYICDCRKNLCAYVCLSSRDLFIFSVRVSLSFPIFTLVCSLVIYQFLEIFHFCSVL